MKHPGIYEDKEKKRIWGQRSWDERIAQHFKAHELPNVAKEKILDHEVYIGVSAEKLHDAPKEYPSGYFKTAFAILKGKTVPVQILEFDGNHDPEMTDSGRLRARIGRTIQEARNAIQTGKEAGFYES